MRILVDYRPALRERTGVGEYIHQLVRAYTALHDDEVAVLSSSWTDRPAAGLAAQLNARIVDRRVPVRVLNFAWHCLEWPPVELLAGRFDVVHAAHPLAIPSRHAARVITIHDLFFLTEPGRMRAEIRRDYARLAPAHARRADAVITSTEHGKRLVADRLGVPGERIYVCPAGAPAWERLGREPMVPPGDTVLFLGTLEARKNIGTLLDAYETLLRRSVTPPRLVLAGRATPDATEWLQRIARPPLAGHVTHLGYVAQNERERLYAGARLLVLPSLDEGFGLTALEAMSAGVPVVVSNRGSLPEVVGAAGTFIEPDDVAGLAAAIERLAFDDSAALEHARNGIARARQFTWTRAAATLRQAYADALARRRQRDPGTLPGRAR
jgi:glycosyltransferase involved in cell wall biosynthesis